MNPVWLPSTFVARSRSRGSARAWRGVFAAAPLWSAVLLAMSNTAWAVDPANDAGRAGASTRLADAAPAPELSDAQMRFRKGVQMAEQKRTTEAIEVFRKLGQEYPTLAEAQNNLAVLYADRGDTEKARAALEAALRGRPSYETVYRNMGVLNARQAAAAYAKALNIDESKVAPARLALITTFDETMAPLGSVAAAAPVPAPAPKPAVVVAPPPPVVVAQAPAAPAPKPVPAPAPAPAPTPAPAPAPAPAPTPVPAPAAAPASAPVPAPVPAIASKPAAPPAAAGSAASAPTAVKPQTAPPAPATPKAPDASADDAGIRKAVQSWAQAWSRKDIDAYVAAYVPGFKGGEASASAWKAARRDRILGKKSINVSLSDISLVLGQAQRSATFTQAYTADQLQLVSRKTLHFEFRDGRWLINRESAASGRS